MKVKVFHTAFETTPVHIATVDYAGTDPQAGCEYAYRWTQNIMDSWSMKMPQDGNDDVTVEVPVEQYGHRSTSMGDYCEADGELFRVALAGFEPATEMKVRETF